MRTLWSQHADRTHTWHPGVCGRANMSSTSRGLLSLRDIRFCCSGKIMSLQTPESSAVLKGWLSRATHSVIALWSFSAFLWMILYFLLLKNYWSSIWRQVFAGSDLFLFKETLGAVQDDHYMHNQILLNVGVVLLLWSAHSMSIAENHFDFFFLILQNSYKHVTNWSLLLVFAKSYHL